MLPGAWPGARGSGGRRGRRCPSCRASEPRRSAPPNPTPGLAAARIFRPGLPGAGREAAGRGRRAWRRGSRPPSRVAFRRHHPGTRSTAAARPNAVIARTSFASILNSIVAKLFHVPSEEFSAGTAQTAGMTRLAALSGESVGSRALWMGQTHVAPGVASGPHHHGERETGVYPVSGHPEFVYEEGGREDPWLPRPPAY